MVCNVVWKCFEPVRIFRYITAYHIAKNCTYIGLIIDLCHFVWWLSANQRYINVFVPHLICSKLPNLFEKQAVAWTRVKLKQNGAHTIYNNNETLLVNSDKYNLNLSALFYKLKSISPNINYNLWLFQFKSAQERHFQFCQSRKYPLLVINRTKKEEKGGVWQNDRSKETQLGYVLKTDKQM